MSELYLLSQYGDRHEDRLPEGIFSSLDKIRSYLIDNLDSETEYHIEESTFESDYDDTCLELTVWFCSLEDFQKLSENDIINIECEQYVIEKWNLDFEKPKIVNINGILPIENFANLEQQIKYKKLILELLEKIQKEEIRGATPFTIRKNIGVGSEFQMRELLNDLREAKEIISTGKTKGLKFSLYHLADKAEAEYEKECNARKC